MTDTVAETSAEVVSPQVSKDPVLNTARTHVWMVNPETDGLWECPIDYADIAADDGWEFAADPSASTVGTDLADELRAQAVAVAPEVETVTGWDPSSHNVDEVNCYIAEHFEESPGESARVYALEVDGKNRSSVKDPHSFGDAEGI